LLLGASHPRHSGTATGSEILRKGRFPPSIQA
jgi:hypothetical protein